MENKRFTMKKNVDLATLEAVIKFYENGGTITKADNARRPKRGYTVGKESKTLRG